MGLVEQAKLDLQRISENLNDFGVAINLIAPTTENVNIVGFHTKHWTGFDLDGVRVSSKTASISIAEKQLTDLAYPTRNGAGEVLMLNHLVNVKDSTGTVKNYIVLETYADEYLGSIVLILGDYTV